MYIYFYNRHLRSIESYNNVALGYLILSMIQLFEIQYLT